MNVAVTDLRADLGHWLDRARKGDEVIVTERGVPVARIVGVDSASTIEALTEAGVIARPASQDDLPRESGYERPQPRRLVSELITEHRR